MPTVLFADSSLHLLPVRYLGLEDGLEMGRTYEFAVRYGTRARWSEWSGSTTAESDRGLAGGRVE